MDLASIPELATHFYHSAQILIPAIEDKLGICVRAGADIWCGLTDPNAMSGSERSLQLVKIAAGTFGFVTSLNISSIEPMLACVITNCEAIMEIGKAGAQIRNLHHGGG